MAWHQDYIAWKIADNIPGPRLINFVIFLDSVNEFNGSISLSPEQMRGLVERHSMYSPKGGVGTAVIFHPEIVHGAAANLSPYPRRVVIATYDEIHNKAAGSAPPRIPREPRHSAPDRPGAYMTMKTSRAVVLKDFRRPPALGTFDVPEPMTGGLTVTCRYGGICGTDLHLIAGHLDIPTPLVLGHEGLGTVDALGEGTERDINGDPIEVGDAVMWASSIACDRCHACQKLREPTLCENRRTYGVNRLSSAGSPLSGSWADVIALEPGTTVVKLPAGIDPIAAMSFACAGPTMIHALGERRPVRLGEIVAVQGSGPVGLAAAALAQLAGAEVIIVGGPPARLAAAKAAGIGDHHVEVVESGDVSGAIDVVLACTRGQGVDLVIECTGVPEAVDQGTRMARRGGSYLIVGQYTDSGNAWFNPHQIVYRQLDMVGSWAFTGTHLQEYIRMLPALTRRFDLPSLVTCWPLTQVGEALHQVGAGTVIKAVLAA